MLLVRRVQYNPFFIRLLHWEYWSFNTIYGLLYPVYIWFCIRVGGKFFFNTANPSIANGGFLMEKKQDVYALIPHQYYPAIVSVKAGTSLLDIETALQASGFKYPFIAKPDIGLQGKAVKKINNTTELEHYTSVCTIDFLIQEFCPFQHEVGIFYYRNPTEKKGYITGIVAKEPMMVKGDGHSTISDLICKEPRYILQLKALKQMHGAKLDQVLNKGEEFTLSAYGNHARGSKFLDWSHKIDDQLEQQIDFVCQQIEGFYFGRLDIMYHDWDDLKAGRNFQIIELNGTGSDPTHIYDPKHSIFFAWKEILRHWVILFRVSQINHQKGHAYMSLKDGLQMFKANQRQVERLNQIAGKL